MKEYDEATLKKVQQTEMEILEISSKCVTRIILHGLVMPDRDQGNKT